MRTHVKLTHNFSNGDVEVVTVPLALISLEMIVAVSGEELSYVARYGDRTLAISKQEYDATLRIITGQ